MTCMYLVVRLSSEWHINILEQKAELIKRQKIAQKIQFNIAQIDRMLKKWSHTRKNKQNFELNIEGTSKILQVMDMNNSHFSYFPMTIGGS
ncbi:hypothetical protein GDO81_003381 [Engystomops pustulosus]|uniref:Uncharacterized protein n=1 Tax=Engystomops pustulosus TaxID=76066 RepID=A0AAV7A329_ENGPU|nr:hypothetical protein GDO81_003381 [Engystomops pustulosus]